MKAIKIRGQLHAIKRNERHGYRTLCGKLASFGHTVFEVKVDEITCPSCADVILAETGIDVYAERLRKIDESECV